MFSYKVSIIISQIRVICSVPFMAENALKRRLTRVILNQRSALSLNAIFQCQDIHKAIDLKIPVHQYICFSSYFQTLNRSVHSYSINFDCIKSLQLTHFIGFLRQIFSSMFITIIIYITTLIRINNNILDLVYIVISRLKQMRQIFSLRGGNWHIKLVKSRLFLLKFQCQARNVSGHVFVF